MIYAGAHPALYNIDITNKYFCRLSLVKWEDILD